MFKKYKALGWIPTAYIAEGLPYAMVVWVSGTLFKDLGYQDHEITFATASITVMWSLKPLYAGLLDMFGTKRFWVLLTQCTMAALLIACALALGLAQPFWPIIGLLWLLAATSATHDICVDGIYVTALAEREQALWIGWQGAFWTTGRVLASAVVVAIAGRLQHHGFDARTAWGLALGAAGACMAALGAYHAKVLPTGAIPLRPESIREAYRTLLQQWADFFKRPQIWGMLAFVLLYRSGEGFLLMETPLFMQGTTSSGGLGMCATDAVSANCPHFLTDKASIDGLLSSVVSAVFGILGGAYASRAGLSTKTLVFMACCLNVPHVTLIYLSHAASTGEVVPLSMIATMIAIEKAGYSFGFVANMLYIMQQIAPGKYTMTHFAFCTALMNLMLVPTQALSGPLAAALGYPRFFWFVLLAAVPSLWAAWRAPFPRASAQPG